jgi:hypothetical protein
VPTKVLTTSLHSIFRGKDGTSYIFRGPNPGKDSLIQLLDACVLVESGGKYQNFITLLKILEGQALPWIVALQFLVNLLPTRHITYYAVPCWEGNTHGLYKSHKLNFRHLNKQDIRVCPWVAKIPQAGENEALAE